MLATKTALTIAAAKAVAEACEAEAKARGLRVVIAIVDDGGHLVLLHRDDGSQIGSVEIATLKARTAVLFRRNTKDFQDVVEGEGRYALLCIPNGIPLDGGVLLKHDDEIIGAIGVSGASDEDDGDIGRIGALWVHLHSCERPDATTNIAPAASYTASTLNSAGIRSESRNRSAWR